MKSYKEIIELYDRKVLTHEIGPGRLHDALLIGLENVIMQIAAEEDNGAEDEPDPVICLLSRPIDYHLMKQIEVRSGFSKSLTIRIGNAFSKDQIITHGDLEKIIPPGHLACAYEEGIAKAVAKIHHLGKGSGRLVTMYLQEIGYKYSPTQPNNKYGLI